MCTIKIAIELLYKFIMHLTFHCIVTRHYHERNMGLLSW